MTYRERMRAATEVAIEKFRQGVKPAEVSPVRKRRMRDANVAQGSGDFSDEFYKLGSENHWSRQNWELQRKRLGL